MINLKRNTRFFVMISALCYGFLNPLNAQDFLKHDFNDGKLGPFESTNERRLFFKNGALECHWKESDYTGSGTYSKKAEFRADNNAYQFKQEFWNGFWVKIHSNTLANNPNTNFALLQNWGFRKDGAANHYFMLQYYGDGSLRWQHRYNMGQNFTRYVIHPDFPKDKFVKVVIHVKLKNVSEGVVQVWIDDKLMLNKTGQTIGFGDQNANGQHNGSYSTPGSWGMYNYENNKYVKGETRTVTFDDVALWNGPNGYSKVNPTGGDVDSGGDTDSDGDISNPPISCKLPWTDGDFSVEEQTKNYSSGILDISCVSEVDLSLDIKGTGKMEDADYINVFYRVDGGALQTIAKNTNAFASKSLSVSKIKGDTLELIVQAYTSYQDEVYAISNIKIAKSVGGTIVTTAVGAETLVHIKKRNATGFAIDAGSGGSNAQNVFLGNSNAGNTNQQWIEISRGSGFYSYQKQGTNHCIDGNKGGALRQNVYLWTCDKNNANQQWKKIDIGDGAFKLIKRNASGYALDGGSNGKNGQNIGLYDASNPSQNLHWIITPVAGGKAIDHLRSQAITIHPNPVTDILNIELENIDEAEVVVVNVAGQTVFSSPIQNGTNTINFSALKAGIYVVKVLSANEVKNFKIIRS